MADYGEFELVPGPGIRAIRIIFRGFWTDETMNRYRAMLHQRAAAAGGQTPVNRVLIDLRSCSIQSPELLRRMAALIAEYATQIQHYGMLMPESPLLALQMKKLMAKSSVTYFKSEREAAAWLAT